jgi:hypothetical protein
MKPNPEEFAKSVLWRLASIQADVYQNQLLLVEILARQTKQKATKIQQQWLSRSRKMTMDRYLESLDAAGIERDQGPSGGDSPPRR